MPQSKRRSGKFLRTIATKLGWSRSPSLTPTSLPPSDPTPTGSPSLPPTTSSNMTPSSNTSPSSSNQAASQSPSAIVDLPPDPDLPDLTTSLGKEVAGALKDIGEVLGQFPFVKTIGGLMVQILTIFEDVRDNPGRWESLANSTLRTFRVLERSLSNAPKDVDLDIRQPCIALVENLKRLFDRAKSKQMEGIGKRLSLHQLDQGLQADFEKLLQGLCGIFQLDVALDTNFKAAVIKEVVVKLPDRITELQVEVKEGNLNQKTQNEIILLGQLRTACVERAHWQPRLACYENTRTEILDEIEKWGVPSTAPLAYLCGIAGLGKTTVSHSAARSFHACDLLGGSFFFSRDDAARRSGHKVWATIAYQLADNHHSFRTHLCEVLKRSLPSTSDRQFGELLLAPLKKSKLPPSPLIIVMDALDECDDATDILQSFCDALDELQSHVKFFVTSRPETRFETIIQNVRNYRLSIDLEASSNIRDLNEYFAVRFNKVPLIDRPDSRPRQRLLERAGGLFIWASTVCDFLSQSLDFDADLRLILDPLTGARDDPEESLWNVYRVIVDRAYNSTKRAVFQDGFRPLLAAILGVSEPLTLAELSDITGVSKGVAEAIISSLHAVLRSPFNTITKARTQ
ncbi:hypothetical protein JAAARDRAFT_60681 [Jaapia argillacea MUCL 33604]|uniref:Nephrocystin 3-like N-terminal domain-containing protein n=1 Tax=Jaapia argillacea MUCL 33604 TaxID=933084 RepID=A0A067PH79_9AGAM|nr:hypothetical protein JAAARDRAFT_60681 [Jaapia argillacea MUCL 33604]